MGYFQAFRTKDDKAVKFEGGEIKELDGGTFAGKTPTATAYYRAVLKTSFADLLNPVGGDTSRVFTIQKDTHRAGSRGRVIQTITEAENNYRWKWLGGSNQEMLENNTTEPKILNELIIINASRWLSPDNLAGSEKSNRFIGQAKLQGFTYRQNIELTEIENTRGNEFQLKLTGFKLIFTDENDTSSRYQYEESPPGRYAKKWTYNYDLKRASETPGTLTSYTELEADSTCKYDSALYYRYYGQLLFQLRKRLSSSAKVAEVIAFIYGNFNGQEGVDGLKGKMDKESELTNAEWQAIKEIAEKNAKQLPNRFTCFYYDHDDELKSFISSISFSEGGGVGYHMRADRVDEVEYKWCMESSLSDGDLAIGHLLAFYMGLNMGFKIASSPSIDEGYKKTNWPINQKISAKSVPGFFLSFFEYYKSFKKPVGLKKRNKPRMPAFPRVSGNHLDAKQGFKLDNKSYRVWKKGQKLSKNMTTRIDAGFVMALSLGNFSVYPKMQEGNKFPAIKASKLPATSFVKWAVESDEKVPDGGQTALQEKWNADNNDDLQLKTDQEWCHLFGHGDGGTEELGNFVAGSKHCNTEQLAIETGLRRVTHSTKKVRDIDGSDIGGSDSSEPLFPQEIKDKLTANVTAYLFPNEGTWKGEEEYSGSALKEILGVEFDDYFGELKSGGDMDEGDDDSEETYRLSYEELKEIHKQLSDDIGAASGEEKEGLLALRRNMEINFFLYLPIARWMRYRIYFRGHKIFEHIYDAQSQSMNVHECQILDFAVERAIYYGIEIFRVKEKKMRESKGQKEEDDELNYIQQYLITIRERVRHLIPEDRKESDDLEKSKYNYFNKTTGMLSGTWAVDQAAKYTKLASSSMDTATDDEDE